MVTAIRVICTDPDSVIVTLDADDALRLDGEYVDLATDWAFMLPIVEMARDPVHIPEPLYLYEPSMIGKGSAGAAVRERIIARIVAKGSVVMPRPACPEGR